MEKSWRAKNGEDISRLQSVEIGTTRLYPLFVGLDAHILNVIDSV